MESVQKVEHELAEEDNASKVKRSTNQASNVNKRDSPAPSKRLMCVEIASLLVVMIVIWFSLALPVVFFYLPVVSNSIILRYRLIVDLQGIS